MSTRVLPGAYVSLNDLSQFTEGSTSLVTGFALKADRGPVNEAQLVTSASDFLTKYTLGGKPGLSADPTFWSIINVLAHTNQMYVVRAAKDPLYGGAVVKKSVTYGTLTSAVKSSKTLTVTLNKDVTAPAVGDTIVVINADDANGNYTVKTISTAAKGTSTIATIVVNEDLGDNFSGSALVVAPSIEGLPRSLETPTEYSNIATSYGTLTTAVAATKTFTTVFDDNEVAVAPAAGDTFIVAGDTLTLDYGTVKSATISKKTFVIDLPLVTDVKEAPAKGTKITIAGDTAEEASLNGTYTVSSATITPGTTETNATLTVVVSETLNANFPPSTEAPTLTVTATLARTTVINGAYTVASAELIEATEEAKATLTVVVSEAIPVDVTTANTNIVAKSKVVEDGVLLITGINPGAYNGKLAFTISSSVDNADMVYNYADYGFDTYQLSVYIAGNSEPLETFLFSLDDTAKEIDGTSLAIDSVVNKASSYIQITKLDDSIEKINSTAVAMKAAGGSDGEDVDASALAAAYDVLKDKTIPISIIGNGCSAEAETNTVQQKILDIATTRKDCMVFLNSRKVDEKKTINSEKAQAIVTYKKGDLGSTTFYGCMYAPHVNYTDNINSRQIALGTDSVAIAGWLDIIAGISYPYAYAGPQNGLVTGVTCDWKIGDESGEAQLLNDASINYVAYDAKQGRYYMQCQNTLQIANSSLRNIAAVLNVLDIKEHLAATLKEYINLPITDNLRRDIKANVNGYLTPMTGVRFYNYAFQDVTTDADIAQDTLRFLLTLSLTRYANKIYCTINVVNSTFDFSLLQSA